MNEFLENLKREASANPTMTLTVVGGFLAAAAKLIDAHGHAKSRAAYARDTDRRIRAARNKK